MQTLSLNHRQTRLKELPNRKHFETLDSVAQVETFDCVADVADSLDGTYILLYDEDGSVEVWIDVDDDGASAPGVADRAIEVTGVTTGMTAAQVATQVATAIHADAKFSASANSATVTVTHVTPGLVAAAEDGDAGFTDFTVTTAGANPATVITTGEVVMRQLRVTNLSTGTVWLQFFDATTVPAAGDAVSYPPVKLAADEPYSEIVPLAFDKGLVIAASSVAATHTTLDGNLMIYVELE